VMTLPSSPWDCLTVVPTDEAGAISVVARSESGTEVVWWVRELDAQSDVRFETSVLVPAGGALGYADCPTLVESPEGFHAQWVRADEASVIATVARDSGPGAAPVLFESAASPGSLQGILHGDFLFRASPGAARQGFVRLNREGEPAGSPIALPEIPESTLEQRRALPSVIEVKGAVVALSYELESARVFEELDCGP
jgi:hypothetical protein